VGTSGRSLRPAVLCGAVLSGFALMAASLTSVPAQAQWVVSAAAPASGPTAYAVIGSLATPTGQAREIAMVNADDANLSDDTIYVAAGTDVLVFRPGASTGSVGAGLGINAGHINALAASDAGVYVAFFDTGDDLWRYSTSAFGPSTPISFTSLPDGPSSIAIGGAGTATVDDDSVYLTYYNSSTSVFSYTSSLAQGPSVAITLANPQPGDITVGGGSTASTLDDTVYVVGNGYGSGTVVQFPPDLSDQSSLRPGFGVATAATYDDSLILGPGMAPMRAVNRANWDDSVAMGADGGFIAVSRSGMVASYNFYTSVLAFVPVGSSAVDDTIGFGLSLYSARDVEFAADGVAYATASSDSVAVIDKITAASANVSSAAVGSTVEVALTLQSGRAMDDSTVSAVWVGDDSVPVTRVAGQNAVSFVVPSGSGSVPLVAELRGGNAISAGNLTIGAAPSPSTPEPPVTASAPRDVVAVAGDESALVSWAAPATAGSYAISKYRVTSSPGGRTCLAASPSTSCGVSGLTNGTSYTMTVSALTGAGWSSPSEPSNAVTPEAAPRPSLVITGSREGKRIEVSGQTTGFGMGGTLRPWTRFLGQSTYSEGTATILVSMDGTFDWSRRTGKRLSVYVQTPDGSVRSNVVTIPAR